ncbi:MAG: response regulator transcription factor, partial [Rufibacter sp.]
TIPVRQLRSYAVSTLQEEAFLPQQEQTLEPVAAAEVKPQVAWPAEKKPVVLVVEDNEDFRYYLKDSLLPYFQVLEAKDGKEGWQKALSHLPDLVVSDLMMPELNGMEFCKKIKADPRTSQIPFVLLTAHASEEKQLKGLGLGANDYLTKPFHFELLLTRLQNLITQRELLQKVFEKKISVQTSENQIVSLDDKLVQKAIKFVEENLSNPDLTVEEMSRELGLSRVHLYKKLVAITGQSPVEFIRKIRLQHAAQFLEKSQLTVAEVAYKVGFNNRKYFSKYFKDEYNILPSHYAMNKQAEAKEV